jgi:type IV secretory pathway VirB2 component (pilin)
MRISHTLTAALAVAAAATFLGTDLALAQSSDVFGTLQNKGTDVFNNARLIMFIVAGLGIVGMAAMAFFGRFDWRWTFSMGGGLVILAAAGGLIYYATHATNNSGSGADGAALLQNTDSLR